MRILVKVGGTLLEEDASRRSIAAQLAALLAGHRLVVVHGGGKQLTRYLEERRVVSRFVDGLRVSDDAVIDGATKVIAGSVNKQLVAALRGVGQLAVGLSGVDGTLTVVKQASADLQFVGEPVRSNGALLQLLSDAGYLAVVACLAADEHGQIYNVNADAMAVSCAEAFGAHTLLFLTDVPGVKNARGEVERCLDRSAVKALIESGVAHGGMQAKLEAALRALDGGVTEVVIAPGHEPDVCARIVAGEPLGTRLIRSAAQWQGAAL